MGAFFSPVFNCAQNLMSVVRQLQSYELNVKAYFQCVCGHFTVKKPPRLLKGEAFQVAGYMTGLAYNL